VRKKAGSTSVLCERGLERYVDEGRCFPCFPRSRQYGLCWGRRAVSSGAVTGVGFRTNADQWSTVRRLATR
jgi:hypothetical protein